MPETTAVSAIFVNLCVTDLKKSMAFWESLGFSFNPQFTDDTAASLVLGPSHYAMLITEARFRDFTPHPRVDAHRNTEVLTALQLGSRAAVETLAAAAFRAGAKPLRPAEDHGWMYLQAFQDLDGHAWEPFFMDMAAMQAATGSAS